MFWVVGLVEGEGEEGEGEEVGDEGEEGEEEGDEEEKVSKYRALEEVVGGG